MLAAAPFSASLASPSQAALVIEVIGDLDATAAQSFAEVAARPERRAGERIVLNLQRVALIDGAGIALLMRALRSLRRRDVAVDVVAASKRVRTALATARIFPRAASPADRVARDRHVMIVRNTDPARDAA